MEFIKLGSEVNIKRTDGRVHSAVVSQLNENSRSVTVEWYERGETKGKEVELDAILTLNRQLMQAPVTQQQTNVIAPAQPSMLPPPTAVSAPHTAITQPQHNFQPPSTNHLSRNSSHSTIEDDAPFDEDGDGDGDGDLLGTGENNAPGPSGTLPIRQTGIAVVRAMQNPTQGAIHTSRLTTVYNPPNVTHRTSRATTAAAAAAVASAAAAAASSASQNGQSDHSENIPPPASSTRTRNQTNQRMAVANVTPMNVGPRRSFVVSEVEKLKENREKRRARQAELKEEKTALMNQDPGNPNWELAAMIREYQSTIEFRPLIDGQPIENYQISVCVRKRPLSRKELAKKELDVISVPSRDQLFVHEPKNKVDLTKFLENHKFRFDYAFDDSCNNELVYKYTAKPLVQTIFEGGMATCFAYGQTGSGKTHTMGGEFQGKTQDCKNGIYAMAAKDVFNHLKFSKYTALNLVVSASFFEIYSGKVFDLLADKQKLRVLEDGKQQVQVVGLTEKVVDSVDEVLKIIQLGNSARTSGQTSANSNSSRSHAIFQIVLRIRGKSLIHGKFSFIDLAGNERGADTSSANRQTRMEGAEINKSLLALKECIRALGKQSAHLPFRVSKLTQVLRDSFIGEKSKTCMIAMISPGLSSCEHTLNTLRYANRVKELVVMDPSERNGGMMDDGFEQMESDDHKNGQMNENDDEQLEHDMSVELYNQHAAISDLQQCEEELSDQHKLTNEYLSQFLAESRELYKHMNYVEYDQDAYCKRSEELFGQLVDLATTFRDQITDFRNKLAREEMLSHKMNPGKR